MGSQVAFLTPDIGMVFAKNSFPNYPHQQDECLSLVCFASAMCLEGISVPDQGPEPSHGGESPEF